MSRRARTHVNKNIACFEFLLIIVVIVAIKLHACMQLLQLLFVLIPEYTLHKASLRHALGLIIDPASTLYEALHYGIRCRHQIRGDESDKTRRKDESFPQLSIN